MPAGVYLHVPFCKSRCSYCDFATDVYSSSAAVERYVNALCREIEEFRGFVQPQAAPSNPAFGHSSSGRRGVDSSDLSIDTIYFGGGTPSLLTPRQLENVLSSIQSKFVVNKNAEITMEMNPATVTVETLKDYKTLGVNRASFGVQTFNDTDLKRLARGHNAEDARHTFRLLREAGFDNVSFDLIIGLPGQTLGGWEKNLDEALSMQPEHLSLYLLEVHQGTPLAEQIRSGRQPQPDEELAAEMYEVMVEKLAAGYKQYEISNFSRPGFESRHNSKYWRLEAVYGFGVSAHSFDGMQRYANERDTAKYVSLIESDGSAEVMREDIDVSSEFAFLGLRMEEGVDLVEYERRFEANLTAKYGAELARLHDSGLVEIEEDRLRLTQKGKLFSNEVFAVFV